jgi:hypothetical protein
MALITCLCEKTVHDLHMLEAVPGEDALFYVLHRDGTKLMQQDGTVLRFDYRRANAWAKALDAEQG